VVLSEKNLLGEQTSPYLVQHKDNPVHWRPWSRAALEEAQSLNRPILLSVGYAACHWCHVMAHECFEDPEVAEVMNRLFVNIKVDREERPDIDQIYMAALSAMGEQGGWPLTMFLTPDAKPFWGGTYFPKTPRFGRPGFIQVLNAIHSAWEDKQEELQNSANAVSTHIHSNLAPSITDRGVGDPPLGELAAKIASLMDRQLGGLRGAPKFPNAPFLDLLWLDWLENGTEHHRDSVLLSLRYMLSGGIYDHVGGGLSRYSTDAQWLVPHFEKMLYDNAQLIRLCCYAYAETGDYLFQRRIEETVGWLLREMRVEGGGFASSLDADSEGEEGKFYLWSDEKIKEVLGEDAARELLATYSLTSPEAWEGNPILHRLLHPDFQPPEQEQRLRELLDHLLEARGKRVRPGLDDKVLVDWNGLTIAALAIAGRQFGRPEWLDAARGAFRFVCESMERGRLPHSIREGRRLFPAIASDYAAMISAAVSLHGALQEENLISQAMQWVEMLERYHAGDAREGYYLTASDNNDVPIRIRGDVDDAVPSATAQIITALTQLATVSGDHKIYEKAVRVAETALARTRNQPYGQLGIVTASALAQRPIKLLLNDPTRTEFVPVANRIPDPRRSDIILGPEKAAAELASEIEVDRSFPGAWLCIGQICLPPIRTGTDLEADLKAARRRSAGW